MLIGNSLPKLIFIRGAILGLRLITPASIVYCAAITPAVIATRTSATARTPWFIILTTYAAAEALCFICSLPLRWYLQRTPQRLTQLDGEERRELVTKCFGRISDTDRYRSKWFLDAPPSDVKRENVKDFLAWSLLDARTPDLSDAEDAELDGHIDQLQERLGWQFQPTLAAFAESYKGFGRAKSLRLSFDTVPIQHRPLLWYAIVAIVEGYTVIRLSYNGFQFYRLPLTGSLKIFPPRPHSLLSRHRSPSSKLSYWYRPHTSKSKAPILFIHGIGIGLYANVSFLVDICSAQRSTNDGDVGIIAVEIMPISMRICSPAMSAAQTRHEIKTIIKAHGWDEVVLVGHSYGSAIAASILRDPTFPTASITMAFLLDPISFMLHLPDVAYNFTRRKPSSASEWMLHYFTSTDPLISHTIARRFQWKDLIVFKDDLPQNIPLTITLSGQDIIVPAREVWQHLTGHKIETELENVEEDSEWIGVDGSLKVLWFGKFNHADIFSAKGARRGIAGMIRHQCISETSLEESV